MEKHNIYNKDINPKAIEVCQILQNYGFQSFIVGGCVRDLLMGNIPKDWDITTDASPEKIIEIFPETIPTGLQHGTVTVVMGKGIENHFEVTTFRVEGKYIDGRRPESVSFVKDIKEDLARRDLTINAIAYDPINKRGVDPFYGVDDLHNGIIRAVGNPTSRFQEDGLRIMRVARFAARFEYQVHEDTLNGMKSSLETLKKISKERISDELSKTLMAKNPSIGLETLQKTGALDIACPLLAGRQLPMLSKQHVCLGELETRLAFLYNRLPVKLVQNELFNLKFSNKEIKRVSFLLNLVEKFGEIHFTAEWNERAYINFIAFIKNEAPDPYEYTINEFVKLYTAMGDPNITYTLEGYQKRIPIVYSRKELQINGNDLIALGVTPGPSIKRLLDACYQEIIIRPYNNNKKYLLDFVYDAITGQ